VKVRELGTVSMQVVQLAAKNVSAKAGEDQHRRPTATEGGKADLLVGVAAGRTNSLFRGVVQSGV
jgi:hypothetical protein